jgi:hypothetical protein
MTDRTADAALRIPRSLKMADIILRNVGSIGHQWGNENYHELEGALTLSPVMTTMMKAVSSGTKAMGAVRAMSQLSGLTPLKEHDPEMHALIQQERARQHRGLELVGESCCHRISLVLATR